MTKVISIVITYYNNQMVNFEKFYDKKDAENYFNEIKMKLHVPGSKYRSVQLLHATTTNSDMGKFRLFCNEGGF